MLQKWNSILINWINCFFNESDKKLQRVSLESLLDIISHLRENLALDESKSSILEAHTVEEFVLEKFPEFLVNPGSLDFQKCSEDETCYVASLLLFFVCVNSKDVDIKSAMCSNLSSEDQETILKFSKRLMDCSPVTRKDVQAAIAEACGQDPTVEAGGSRPLVAETPPALRSLHGEVRRLQAALDAERFDRNFLQEELARTNLKVEKLAKDKEQYKLEVLNLKAKISMCCGQESDSRVGDAVSEGTAKLMRQLEETEERLVQTQGQLDDAQCERDLYKVKITELKQERDKLVTQSLQDSALVSQLSEDLEGERRTVQSLRELLAELRQHHQLNRMDSSQFECDDPDASIHSLQHNSSVCSEACANVIEVQLGEERAKIVVLKQHIQTLQEQLNDLTQKTESEKLSLERIVSERENDIFSLKHRINEEIEEKNNLTIQYSDDVSKLNNEINELEQQLKDNNNQCRLIVEIKMQEIQTLQEEKLSLLQSLTDETTKLENDIKKLTSDLEVERNSRAKLKEDYENHIMKLNDKVLNRNNELVELQNNVFKKSEQIEAIYLDLRKERQAKDKLIEEHRSELEEITEKLIVSENTVQRKSEEIKDLVERLNYNFEVNKEYCQQLENLKYSLSEQNDNCNMLEATKERLLEEIAARDNKIEELYKDIDNFRNNLEDEREKFTHDIDSATATADTLQAQLQDELQYKISVQNENTNLKHAQSLLSDEVQRQKEVLIELKNEIRDKDKIVEGMNLCLQEEQRVVEKFKFDCQHLNEKVKEITEDLNVKNDKIKLIEDKLISERKSFEEELCKKDVIIQDVNDKLSSEIESYAALELQLRNETEKITHELNEKAEQIAELNQKSYELNKIVEQSRKCFQVIEWKLEEEMLKCTHLEKTFNTHTSKLMHKLNITENVIKELKIKYKNADEDKQHKIRELNDEIKKLNQIVKAERDHVTSKINHCIVLEETKERLLKELTVKETEIAELRKDIENLNDDRNNLTHHLDLAMATVTTLEIKLQDELQTKVSLQNEIVNLKQAKSLLTIEIDNQKAELSRLNIEIENKDKVIDGMDLCLQEEKRVVEKVKMDCSNLNEQIQKISEGYIFKNNKIKEIEDQLLYDKKSFEKQLSEKDTIIQDLVEKFATENEVNTALEMQLKDEIQKNTLELSEKTKKIADLQEHTIKLNDMIEKNRNCFQIIESKLQEETLKCADLENNFESYTTNLMLKLNNTDKVIKELKSKYKRADDEKALQILVLKADVDKLNLTVDTEREHTTLAEREKEMLTEKLSEEVSYRTNVEKEYQNLMSKFNAVTHQLNSEILLKTKETDEKVQILLKSIDEKRNEVKTLEEKLTSQINNEKEITDKRDREMNDLKKHIGDLQKHNERTKQELEVEVEKRNETIQVLQNAKEQLNTKMKNLAEEMAKLKESYAASSDTNARNIQTLQNDNQSLINELNDVKVQLEVKVHSLKEKLVDNDNLTEKLKKTYESQIENLNVMVTKLSNYLKDKAVELEALRKEKERLLVVVDDSNKVIKSLEEEVKSQKQNQEKLISDFESERLVLKNMVTVTESVMEDQKLSLTNTIAEHLKAIEVLTEENKVLKDTLHTEGTTLVMQIQEKETLCVNVLKQLTELRQEKENKQKEFDLEKQTLLCDIEGLKNDLNMKLAQVEKLEVQNQELIETLQKCKEDVTNLQLDNNEMKIKLDSQQVETIDKIDNLSKELYEKVKLNKELNVELLHQQEVNKTIEEKIKEVLSKLETQIVSYDNLKREKSEYEDKVEELKIKLESKISQMEEEVKNLQEQNLNFINIVEENKIVITKLEHTIEKEKEQKNEIRLSSENEKLNLTNKCSILQEYQTKAEKQLEEQQKDILALQEEVKTYKSKMETCERELKEKDREKTEKEILNVNVKRELETRQKEITTLQEELKNFKSKVVHCEQEFNKMNRGMERNAENINVDNKEEIIALQEEVKTYKSKVETYENNLIIKDREIKEKEEMMIMMMSTLQEQVDTFKSKEETYKQGLKEKNREIVEKEMLNVNLNKDLDTIHKELTTLQEEVKISKSKVVSGELVLKEKDKEMKEKEELINIYKNKELESKKEKDNLYADLQANVAEANELRHKVERANENVEKALRSEEWVKAIGQRETFAVATSEKTASHKNSGPLEKDYRDFLHQVDNTTSDLAHSSLDSIKTISDLERIIHDKNRTITTLQSDITYLKSMIADSENKLLDLTKELEVSKENCHQLSSQLKKIVHQKNEEIADLKKQVNKMSVNENRATQIIKVSAKYQAIILKRIAEIKSNTVLKELTNFGNSANCDNDLRRSLNAGTITMEDLENFLETTDKHLKRCSEKQVTLQKERDRLTEVNRINESEIINLKKFLTELSVSFKTFSTVKDLYAQKFSRVVSMQRTVRREILNLDGRITDTTMCKLERGYAAVMQDLAECVMNMERWVERCIGRTISPEKIKQAFTGDEDRASLASASFQNTSLEVQLEELENSFQKLLEEVVRAQKGEGAVDAQAVTVMEVRAEYEDKLNRMKAKMKQLYQEQIAVFKDKQRDEIALLERELAKTRDKMAESSKAYEEHIRGLTAELWSVGEKFLTKKDEVDWLRKRQRSGSLMSLQHVHSSGLMPSREEPSRPSDTHSLRSLPVQNNNNNSNKREGRGLHMSDEEGEVFDNRWLKELATTPGRPSIASSTPSRGTGVRLSELQWRNSMCPPHLKSSYPAETQFVGALNEEDIKFSLGGASTLGGRNQRKEVGITAYKKPGPPTPSKQAGRLSATDSELRESLRVEAEPAAASRKTSTPSRLRSLFRSNKNDTAEGTPRSKRLSIFRKK